MWSNVIKFLVMKIISINILYFLTNNEINFIFVLIIIKIKNVDNKDYF